jgi:parvulin-like peptidyl-prolyl isomerase
MNGLQLLLILSLLATLGHRLHAATEQVHVRAGLVAVVNGRLILDSDIREKLSPTLESLRRQYTNDPAVFEQKSVALGEDVLENLINDELILTEAREAGREVTKEHLDHYTQDFIQTKFHGDSNVFLKTLAAQGTTLAEWQERHAQNDLVAAARQDKIENLLPPTPQQIEQYYHSHEKDFWMEESVKLSLIMINKNPTNGLAAVETQRKEVAAIHARLIAGADFAAEAKLHSQGAHAEQGGDWGWVERRVLRKELEVVAFSLKPAEVSDVVETEGAWSIMRVVDHRPGALKPITEVREEIGKILQTQERSAVIKQWLGKLRAKAFLRYYGGVAADTVWPEHRVIAIEIKHIGVSTISDAVIRSHLGVKEGELLTQASVDHDIRSLYGTGDFYNIRVSEAAVAGGSKLIHVTYFVQEKPLLSDIQFTGNKNISSRELLQKLTSKTGERMDERKMFNDSQTIQSMYQKAGYPQATVKSVPGVNQQTGRGSIMFEVNEGPQ